MQILGLLLVTLGLLIGLSLITLPIRGGEPLVRALPVQACGFVGMHLGRWLSGLVGVVPALGLPLVLLAWGMNRVLLRQPTALFARSVAFTAFLFFLAALLALGREEDGRWVGRMGSALAVDATGFLGGVGAHLVMWAGLLVALLALLDLGFADVAAAGSAVWAVLRDRWDGWKRGAPAAAGAAGVARSSAGTVAGQAASPGPRVQALADAVPATPVGSDLRRTRRAERDRLAAALAADLRPPRVARPDEIARDHPGVDAQAPITPEANPPAVPGRAVPAAARATAAAPARATPAASARATPAPAPATLRDPVSVARTVPPPPAARPVPPRPRGTAYELPSSGLLAASEASAPAIPEAEILKSSRLLEQTLSHFDITGKVTEVVPGPVITRYAFEPAPGVKVNQILSRADDLALALRAHRLRILAPIPGKGAVGIEVPNLHPETVHLGNVVAVELFQRGSGLLLALGKDVSGVPVVADLKKMPHLLIAGATGSGKSVCVNAIVVSLLLRMNPNDLRLVMIDPKMLELTGYNGIPHLLMPVVTESRMAAKALRFLVSEMQRRYQRLARRGVRSIEAFNASLGKHAGLTPEVPEDEAYLPHLVVIVDELADLMLTLGNEIEDPIARLAQMARAVGIHLVVATQRPSVDVITGMIKANFPSRIAFQVASKVDSRTIMDQNGAEALLGRGDMLYLPAGRPDPIRIHGAFVSDREMRSLVAHWSEFEPPTPALDVERLAVRGAEGGEAEGGDDDELFGEAQRVVVQTGIGSTSLLQRRLKVGYARAGRLMDLLEQAGVVGPPDGSRAREVLIRPGDLPD
jgi:S-DNA-T family DNA segregation ATPase FtsK/SpoIIIE